MPPSPTGYPDARETWNRRYLAAGESLLFGAEPNAWLRAQAPRLTPGGRWLCVADGEGRNSVWLAQQGLQVDAFDLSEVAVDKARALAAARGVQVRHAVADGDALAWPQGLYDGIAAIFIQFAPPDMRARLFARMAAALRPGGLLLLQGYTPKQLDYRTGGPPQVEHLYTEALLRGSFPTLDIVELRAYEDEVDEGAGHRGRSALVGLVARRR